MTEQRPRDGGAILACMYLLASALVLGGPQVVWAQQTDSLPPAATPVAVAREAAARYNVAALRSDSATTIDSGRVVDGDVGVLEATLTVAGTVRGSIVVINGNLRLRPGGRVDGDVLVVGGAIVGLDSGLVTGEVRAYQHRIEYHRDGGAVAIDLPEREGTFSLGAWRRRLQSDNGIRVRAFNPYNRVEGLPIYAGPVITRRASRGLVKAELFGILRSAQGFRWDSENLGYRATLELRGNGVWQPVMGGRIQDVMESVEPWQLTDTETGLATFFLHRDYRDWYSRLGGSVYAGIAGPRGTSLIGSYADERQASRRLRDPWTLFRNDATWRANPTIDDGRFHVAKVQLQVDSRNDVNDPWAGWYVTAEVERTHGRLTSRGARSGGGPIIPFGAQPIAQAVDEAIAFTRALVDVRRYNRLSPESQLNARLVIGGWLGGDELPLQRKLSVGGPGTIPGYDFRQFYGPVDFNLCSERPTAPGAPAECDRAALAQLEYRVDLDLERIQRQLLPGYYGDAAVVLFVDAGRGWRTGPGDGADGGDPMWYPSGDVPAFNTFRSDVGAGIDFTVFGLYVAKAVSVSREPANFVVRVRHRF